MTTRNVTIYFDQLAGSNDWPRCGSLWLVRQESLEQDTESAWRDLDPAEETDAMPRASSYSLGLTTTAPGSLVVGALAERNRTHNEGPEVFEGLQGSSGNAAWLALAEQSVGSPLAVTALGTLSGKVDWVAIAFELASGGLTNSIDVPGVTGQVRATAASDTVLVGGVISQNPAVCVVCGVGVGGESGGVERYSTIHAKSC